MIDRADRTDARRRLVAQALVGEAFAHPAEAVHHLGCAQGQDLPGAVASIALRTGRRGADGARAVHDGFGSGSLVRGYPMRGTLFVTTARDLGWMTALTSTRQLQQGARRRAELGIDDRAVARAIAVATDELADGPRPKDTVLRAWTGAGIDVVGGRGYHLVFTLAVHGILAYGPIVAGEQQLVDARRWLPEAALPDVRDVGGRAAAIAEFLRRYLTAHGPASARDFSWWTKLPLGEIVPVLPAATAELRREDGGAGAPDADTRFAVADLDERVERHRSALRRARLVPGFDEFVLGYPDRSFAIPTAHADAIVPGNNGVFRHTIVVDGRVRGVWRAVGRGASRRAELTPFGGGTSVAVERQLARAFAEYPVFG